MIKLGFQGFVSEQVYSLNSSIKEMNAVLEMGNEKEWVFFLSFSIKIVWNLYIKEIMNKS